MGLVASLGNSIVLMFPTSGNGGDPWDVYTSRIGLEAAERLLDWFHTDHAGEVIQVAHPLVAEDGPQVSAMFEIESDGTEFDVHNPVDGYWFGTLPSAWGEQVAFALLIVLAEFKNSA